MISELNKICDFYSSFSQRNLSQLPEIYSPDCVFVDPIHELHGIDSLREYFHNLAENLLSCEFVFHSIVQKDQAAFLSWTMYYRHVRLKAGAPLELKGVSELKLEEGKVKQQIDYYDMGAMLYEKIPLLSSVIGVIKSKVAHG